MNIPDWPDIANNLIANAIWASPFVGWYVWKHRQAILNRLRNRPPVLLSGSMEGKGTFAGELTNQTIHGGGIGSCGGIGGGTLTVSKDLDLTWNIQAPTSSLTKRLMDEGLELLSWYIRLS